MRISAKCDYACRALLELSLHWPKEEPLQIQEIAEKQNIPLKYLVQILIQLKRMGIVDSVRGKQGGYRLSKAPKQISLGKVIRNIAGPLLAVSPAAKHLEEEDFFNEIWKEVEGAISGIVDGITFEDINEKAQGADKVLNYQI
jgi:Rrf2 family protein